MIIDMIIDMIGAIYLKFIQSCIPVAKFLSFMFNLPMWMYYLFFGFFILSLCTPNKRTDKKTIKEDETTKIDHELIIEEIDMEEYLAMKHDINKLKQHIKNLNQDMLRTKRYVSKLYEKSMHMSIVDY